MSKMTFINSILLFVLIVIKGAIATMNGHRIESAIYFCTFALIYFVVAVGMGEKR